MIGKASISLGKIVRDNMTLCVEVNVTGERLYKYRLWLGKHFVWLAAKIIGCGFEVKVLPTREDDDGRQRECVDHPGHYPRDVCPGTECRFPDCLAR